MLVLGIHSVSPVQDVHEMDPSWAYHDAAAVLVENGTVLAAIEEERLNRIKHASVFPAHAIRGCLDAAGVTLDKVDRIAIDSAEPNVSHYYLRRALDHPTAPLGGGRDQVAALFRRDLGADVAERLRFVGHHRAHLWSAFQPSGFERGLAVSIDGAGDYLSAAMGTFREDRLKLVRVYPARKSLGFFYRECLALIGYTRFDEYKVMGLAPYGDPARFADLFAQAHRLLPDGEYEVTRGDAFVRLLESAGLHAHARRKGELFTQIHRDFAAALQATLERIVMHLLTYFQTRTGERHLCLAGGVAHNCSMNGQIAYSGLFDRVWVQPAAHDAGNALGAALSVLHDEHVPLAPSVMRSVYFGADLPPDAAVACALGRWGDLISCARADDVVEAAARLLADGAVIGWVQGRSEFGPRALGNRSILADPRPVGNRDRINAMVKKREAYRPFAPSIREERAADYLELPGGGETSYPFMTFALRVRAESRALLGAVTHVDGTARVQTVARDANPRYWSLLLAFERLTGVPILLNTSFNNNAEPIVDSVDDAVTCFLTTGLDVLVIGDYVIRKPEVPVDVMRYEALRPALPPTRTLMVRMGPDGPQGWALQSTVNRFFGEPTVRISREAFQVLHAADGRTLGDLLASAAIVDSGRRAVLEEMADLWTRRVIDCRPRPCRAHLS